MAGRLLQVGAGVSERVAVRLPPLAVDGEHGVTAQRVEQVPGGVRGRPGLVGVNLVRVEFAGG